MELCCAKVKNWMSSNQLKLNEGKTEVMIFGKPSGLKKLNITSIRIGDSRIIPSLVAINIGVDLDLGLKLEKQVNKMVSSGWYHLSNISRVRKYFTQEATEALVHAFVISKLDAYNSILACILSFQIQKLQKIQNAATKFDSATKIRKELHWLPIPHRIQYKLLLLTYKSLHGQGPKYLIDLLEPYTSRQPSRLAKDGGALTLKVHRTKYSKYGDRAFAVTFELCHSALEQSMELALYKSHYYYYYIITSLCYKNERS